MLNPSAVLTEGVRARHPFAMTIERVVLPTDSRLIALSFRQGLATRACTAGVIQFGLMYRAIGTYGFLSRSTRMSWESCNLLRRGALGQEDSRLNPYP